MGADASPVSPGTRMARVSRDESVMGLKGKLRSNKKTAQGHHSWGEDQVADQATWGEDHDQDQDKDPSQKKTTNARV